MSQFSVPCTIYRGGTSRGLIFKKKDLPSNPVRRNKIFIEAMDAYNPSQINGLGGTTSHTNKICVIAPSDVEGADVDFTFYQMSVAKQVVDEKGTCGNMMSAVGAFAVDEGMVKSLPEDDHVTVGVYNTNIKKMLKIRVPVINGQAKVTGDYLMPGLVRPGALIRVEIVNPGGGTTGETQVLGARCTIQTAKKSYEISFADVINPIAFIDVRTFGLTGDEPSSVIAGNAELLEELNSIRDEAAVKIGLAKNRTEARQQAPSVPKIAMVAPAQDYITTSGRTIRKEEIDIVAKLISMGKLHKTFAASGLYCLASSIMLTGTIPNEIVKPKSGVRERTLRIGHPDGIVEVRVALTDDGRDIAFVGMDRTARRIMKGEVFIPVD